MSNQELHTWWNQLSEPWQDMLILNYKGRPDGKKHPYNKYRKDHQVGDGDDFKIPNFPTEEDLKNIIHLKKIDIHIPVQIDLEPLLYLQDLESLQAAQTKNVKDLKIISQLPKLRELRLIDVPIEDINEIFHLRYLENLVLSGTLVEDISVIKSLKNLQTLSLYGSHRIQDLSPLKALCNLIELDGRTPVTNIEFLKYLKFLKKLNISGMSVDSLTPIQELKNIEELVVSDTGMDNLKLIKECVKLKRLVVAGTAIKNLEGIEKLTALEHLDLAECKQLTSLKGLENMHKLKYLDISYTQIQEIQPLLYLKNLEIIHNDCTHIIESELAEIEKYQPNILVRNHLRK